MADLVNRESLVWLYLREIRQDGRTEFVEGTLADLKAAQNAGEVATVNRGDRSTTMRLSPIAIEARLGAAREALDHFDNGTEPGGRSVMVDWSTQYLGL